MAGVTSSNLVAPTENPHTALYFFDKNDVFPAVMMFAVSFNGSRALTSDEVQDQTTPLSGSGLSAFASPRDAVVWGADAALRATKQFVGEEFTPLGSPHPLMARDLIVAGRLEVDAQWQ